MDRRHDHEHVAVPSVPEMYSVRDVAERFLRWPADDALAQVTLLMRAHAVLRRACKNVGGEAADEGEAGADNEDDDLGYAHGVDGQAALRRVAALLAQRVLRRCVANDVHAALSVPHADTPQASRFVLAYIVYAHVLVLLDPTCAAAHCVPARSLVRRNLVCYARTPVARYTMSQLRLAYDALRDALDTVVCGGGFAATTNNNDDGDGSEDEDGGGNDDDDADGGVDELVRYVRALELRAAHLLVGTWCCHRNDDGGGEAAAAAAAVDEADDTDYDVVEWCAGVCNDNDNDPAAAEGGDNAPPTVTTVARANEAFAETMAWWMAHVRRHVNDYLDVGSPRYLATNKHSVVAVVRVRRCAAPRAALLRRLHTMAARKTTDDDRRDFAQLCAPYDVRAGDGDVHSRLYGLAGRATLRDILTRERSPDAANYAVFHKYADRAIQDWLASAAHSADADHERAHRQLCALHLVDRYFVGRHQLNWAQWYLALQRAPNYAERVRDGARNGAPFVAQRLGRYACVLPLWTCAEHRGSAAPGARAYAHERGWVARDNDNDAPGAPSVLVLECRDALDALVTWFQCTLHGCGGVAFGGVRMSRALRWWIS